MITCLKITNFAIIDELALEFEPGFTVLSGETGAGKSILVAAVGLLLGGRSSSEVVRTGCEEAVVEGVFHAAGLGKRLEAAGLPGGEVSAEPPQASLRGGEGGACLPTEAELAVRRTISRSGRSRIYLNGSPGTLQILTGLTRGLVDISGQHQHISLTRPEAHLEILDAFGSHLEARGLLGGRYREWQGVAAELARLQMDEGERASRIDYLRFQLREIEEVDPRPGEDEELAARRKVLANAERLYTAASSAEAVIYSREGAAVEATGRALQELDEAARLDLTLAPLREAIAGAQAELEEVARDLADYAAGIDLDPSALEQVEERLERLRRLRAKHGGSLEEVRAARDRIAAELERLSSGSKAAGELEQRVKALEDEVVTLALDLSRARRKSASAFSRQVREQLGSLGMRKPAFLVEFEAAEDEYAADNLRQRLTPEGIDRVQYLFSANVGEDPHPLHRIASGGELSRLMLAIKAVLVRRDSVDTYIFDEVDAGIGGRVASEVGRRIRRVSRGRQVLCLTHLPQIAVQAERHYLIEKEEVAGRTLCRISPMGEEERVEEIARMLGGTRITESTRAHARDLLGAAGR